MSRPEDPSLSRGIKRRFIDANGTIVGPAWYRAFEGKDVIGTCRERQCEGLMVALPNQADHEFVWYLAECLSCGHQVASPDGRTLTRSSRRYEMPEGAWERRMQYLSKLAELGKKNAAEAA